jgi:hypothetical protein
MTILFIRAELAEAALFDENGILPVQFFQRGDGGKEDAAIRRLMTAILVDAVHCYEVAARCGWKKPKRRKRGFGFSVNIPIFRFPSATYVAN